MVTVEHEAFDLGQQRVRTIEVTPARLNHPDARVLEVRDHVAQKVGRRDEVRVEDGNELALRGLEPCVEGARFVPYAIGAVNVLHVDARLADATNVRLHDGARLVRRVVEHLNLEEAARIIEGRCRIEQTVSHGRFIEERELHGHARKHATFAAHVCVPQRLHRRPFTQPARVAQACVDEVRTVDTVRGQEEQNGEIGGTKERVHGRHRGRYATRCCHGIVKRCMKLSQPQEIVRRAPETCPLHGVLSSSSP